MNNPSYVEKISKKDQIEIIREKKGIEFEKYREKYNDSLNYQNNYKILDFPITVTLEMINKCNLKCIMCYTDHHKKTKATLSLEDLDKFLNECKNFKTPAIIIGLASEILLYKGIKEVVTKITKANFLDVMFSTNATLLNEEMSKFLI